MCQTEFLPFPLSDNGLSELLPILRRSGGSGRNSRGEKAIRTPSPRKEVSPLAGREVSTTCMGWMKNWAASKPEDEGEDEDEEEEEREEQSGRGWLNVPTD